jgi:hypothetical protein
VTKEEIRRNRRRKSAAGRGRKAGFLASFGPNFLLSQAIKSTVIYRRWKREILSTLGKLLALDSVEKYPNR